MGYTVVKLGELCLIPTIGCADKVACDALQLVYAVATTLGAGLHRGVGILVAAVETAVSVVVHRAVTDVVGVHHVYYAHDRFGVVYRVAVHLNVEDVSATCEVVVGCLDFGFVACAAFVVYRYVVRVCVVVAVCNAGEYSVTFAVATRPKLKHHITHSQVVATSSMSR